MSASTRPRGRGPPGDGAIDSRPLRSLLAAVLAGAIALTVAVGVAVARPGQIHELALGSSSRVYLFGLTTGADGRVWFADLGCSGLGPCAIGRIDGRSQVTLFSRGLRPGSVPFQLALGPDGTLWFTDEGRHPAIGRITAVGRITEYTRGLRADTTPFAIAPGPGGDMWFTAQGKHPGIGRITPHGRITVYARGLQRDSAPFGIAGTPGSVWFTDHGCASTHGRCAVGHVTSGGRISETRRGLRSDTEPLAMAPGFAGSVWFADSAGAIGQITASGHVAEHSLPAGSAPVGIAPGPDGNMWFTDEGANPAIGRIAGGGGLREFSAGLNTGSLPAAITAAPDGQMWFTDEGRTAAVGLVSTGARSAVTSAPGLTGIASPGHTLSCGMAGFAAWDGLVAGAPAFNYDGTRWLRDGWVVAHGPTYLVGARDAGQRLSCTVTATYPAPLLTPAVARSRTVRISS